MRLAVARRAEWTRLCSLLDNPIYQLEAGGLRASWRALRGHFWGWRGASTLRGTRSQLARCLLTLPILVVMPYISRLVEFLSRFDHTSPPPTPDQVAAMGVGLAAFTLLLWAWVPSAWAAASITTERERQTFEPLLLSRLTSADIVIGKAAVRLVPGLALLTLVLPFWLLWPPMPPDAWGVLGVVRLSIRPFLVLLWADSVAAAVAFVMVGVAVSAWSSRSHWASAGASLAPFAAIAPAFALVVGTPVGARLALGGYVDAMDLRYHAAAWLVSAVVAYVSFLLAQAGLEPDRAFIRLRPGGSVAFRPARRAVAVAALALLLAAGLGCAVPAYLAGHVVGVTAHTYSRGPARRARALISAGRDAEALPALEDALRLRPAPLVTMGLRREQAWCLMRLQRYRQALAALQALRGDAEGTYLAAEAGLDAGYCFEKLGDRASASRLYHAAGAELVALRRRGARPAMVNVPRCALALVWDLAGAGDRAGALETCDWIARQGWPATAAEAREEATLLRENLDRAPRMGVDIDEKPPFRLQQVYWDAKAVGLKAGDILLSVDGRPYAGLIPLRRTLARRRPGDRVPVVVERAGRRMAVQVRLTARL